MLHFPILGTGPQREQLPQLRIKDNAALAGHSQQLKELRAVGSFADTLYQFLHLNKSLIVIPAIQDAMEEIYPLPLVTLKLMDKSQRAIILTLQKTVLANTTNKMS